MQPHKETEPGGRRRLNKVVVSGLALLGVGGVAGGVASMALSSGVATAATTTTAPASSGTSGSSSSGSSSSSSTGTSVTPQPGGRGPGAPPGGVALPLHGTVTAVGASSVTIKTTSGTETYVVTDSSSIDKNGKATLSALAVGDDVAFSTVTTDGTTAIDKLIAGNMAGGCGHAGSGTAPATGHGTPPSRPSGATGAGAAGSTG